MNRKQTPIPVTRSMQYVLYCLAVLLFYTAGAQSNQAAKALALLKRDKDDTNKVNHLVALCDLYKTAGKTDSALIFGGQAYALATQLNFSGGQAEALHNMANVYEDQGNYEKAMASFSECLKIRKGMGDEAGVISVISSIGIIYMDQGDYGKALEDFMKAKEYYEKRGDKKGLARMIGNIGIVYRNQGNYPQAIAYYFKAMQMNEELGNKEGIATNAGNLGVAFMNQNDYNKALEYYGKALSMYEELGDKDGIATNLGNMGIVYVTLKNYPKALEYFFKSITLYKTIGDKDGVATTTGNIGHIYYEEGEYDEALKYFSDALKMNIEVGDKGGIAVNTGSEGEVYLQKKQYDKAEKLIKSAIDLADSIQEMEVVRDCNLDISKLYMQTGRWREAYNAFKRYTIAKDSLLNEDRSTEIGRLEAKAEYDKQFTLHQTEDEKKATLAVAGSKRQKLLIAFIGVIAIIVAFLAAIIFRSLKTTRKQKEIIGTQKQEMEEKKLEVEKQKEEVEKQKEIVEQKNKDIIDSITYAKRLQEALIPPVNEIKKYLPESFVLYKPKDIVAGDFYWMQPLLNSPHSKTVIIAAGDCTGHGVPGAMVSVVCSNALNRTVKEFGITEPGKILDKTRELVIETFMKSEGKIEDGMDISLASLSSEADAMIIKWAGAFTSLWYTENGEIKAVEGDKQHIGETGNSKNFLTHTIALSSPGTLYLFTDGFAEQIGGPRKEKFGMQRLQEQLSRTAFASMDNQKLKLEQVFDAWKGQEKQTDDVLVIGIRV